ncbi:MAG: hypothetical protein IKP60_12885 [Treponema sp.]|nr:hypothetical protein [Treponema sp.]
MKNNIDDELQIRTYDTALDFFDVVSKKGPREFITKMGELSIRSQELHIRSLELDTNLEIARTELRKTEIIEKSRTERERIKEHIEELKTEREVRIEELKTERVRIKEQSKCLQKLMETSKEAYDKKIGFYDSLLKSCMEYFTPQIQSLDQRISVLNDQYNNSNSEDQKVRMQIHKQLRQLEKTRNEINDRVAGIVSNLTTASKIAHLDFDTPITGYIK